MTRAVFEDEKQNYKDAYYEYCEGLQYFVPLIASETDAEKRLHLQQVATNYMERAEEIRRSYTDAFMQQMSGQGEQNVQNVQNVSEQGEPSCSTTENPVQQALKPASNYKQIRELNNNYHINFIYIQLWELLIFINEIQTKPVYHRIFKKKHT